MLLKIKMKHQAHKPVKNVQLLGPDFRNGMVKKVKLRQRAKFRGARSNRRQDMAIFSIFQHGGRRQIKMADAAILDFWSLKFFNVRALQEARIASSFQIWSKAVIAPPD